MNENKPEILNGGIAVDDRGNLKFINDFNFKNVKRMYQVENISKDVIRAFHGHMLEGKYVYVPKGTIKIVCCKIIDKDKSININANSPHEFILSSLKPSILWIPEGYANGFKALEDNTIIQFFSTSTLEESKGDDYRFDWYICGEEIWKTKNR